MDEELNLLKVDQTWKLKDQFLRVHAETLALPTDQLALIRV
jgi:hypothetical protein